MSGWLMRISGATMGGVLGAALFCAPPVMACDLPEGETATVAAIEDGETIELTDGRKVRLLGVKAPSAPLGKRSGDPWPFVAEAKTALSRLASGAKVELRFDERRSDRHGHLLAQVYVVRGGAHIWVQEALVQDGFARVYALADARACMAELLAREDEARKARRGIWHSWAYRVQDAEDAKRLGRLNPYLPTCRGHRAGGRRGAQVDLSQLRGRLAD